MQFSFKCIRTVLLAGLLAGICPAARAQSVSVSRPNIVLIYMDDMGWGDVDAYGGIGYRTPHLDQLAAEGMRFTSYYSVQPICSASRAAILTGCYPNRIGIHGALMPHSSFGLSDKEETIAGMLKQVGYVTGIIGKWHLGDAKKFLPLQHGFDEYFGLPYSNDMWPMNYDGHPFKDTSSRKARFPPLPLMEGNKVLRYIRTMDDQNMLTTWYTRRAIDFIGRHSSQPFFLYLAHSMVHVPLGVSDKFRGKSQQGLFGDVMMEIDWSVGQVMAALKKDGLEKKTLVIFASDNGPWLMFGNHAGSAGGLREGKSTTWDGGVREPFIVRWPGVIPAGTVCNRLAANIDVLPTLAAVTGAPLPPRKIDGVSILPLLKEVRGANPRDHIFFYYRSNDLQAIRQGSWTLMLPHTYRSAEHEVPGKDGWPGKLHTDSTGLALYDERRDPGERYDVKDENPKVVARMLRLAENAREDLGDALTGRPGKNRRPPGLLSK